MINNPNRKITKITVYYLDEIRQSNIVEIDFENETKIWKDLKGGEKTEPFNITEEFTEFIKNKIIKLSAKNPTNESEESELLWRVVVSTDDEEDIVMYGVKEYPDFWESLMMFIA